MWVEIMVTAGKRMQVLAAEMATAVVEGRR